MAKNEIVNVITLKTEQSQNTIKGLKKEIADLKKNLETAEIGSKEFEQASKDLTRAQNELKTVIADGKKSADAIDGSYNQLAATMAELKKEWKATADEVKRNELGKQIDEINSQLKDMDASIGNFQRNVGDYANSFEEALEKQQKATKNLRTGLEGLQKTAAGLASGYAAVQGVMNLLNIENSKFEEAMIKVQSAMAIAQGIGGMKDLIEGGGTLITVFKNATTGVKAFIKGLSGVKAAIVGTGIGALVVAVGTLVAYWDDLMALIKKDKGEVEKLKTEFEGLKNDMKAKDEDFEFFIKLQEAAGKSRREILKLIEAQASTRYEDLYAKYNEKADSLVNYKTSFWGNLFGDNKLKELEKQVAELKEMRDAAYKAWQSASNAITLYDTEQETKKREDAAAATKAQLDQSKDIAERARQATIDTKLEELAELQNIYEQEKALLEKYGIDTAKLTEEYNKKVAEINEKYESNPVLDEQKRLADQEHNIDKWAELERRKLDKQQQVRDEWAAENKVDLDGNGDSWYTQKELDNYQAFLDTKQQMYADAITAENLLIETQIQKLKELADAQAAAGMDNTGILESIEKLRLQIEDNNKAILKNEKDTLNAKEKANKEYEENEKKRKKLTYEYSLDIASNTLGSLSQIIGEETAVGKAAAVAQTTIDTYQSAQAAFKSLAGIPIVGPALGAAAAAAAALAGAANIKKILAVKTDGISNGNVDTSTTTATPSVNLSESMPVQYTRDLLTDSEMSNINQEQRVYVVEDDITSTQNKVKVTENNASF